MAPKSKNKSVKPSAKVKFPKFAPLTNDAKIKLAASVQQYPEIWRLDHPRYKLRDTHGKAWEAIAQIMELPGN